jgi:PKD repeat protein
MVFARDANGQPLRNLALRADIKVNGTVTDFGRLSMKNFATGSDGRGVTVYTAPQNVDSVDRGTKVTIAVTPVGSDARGDFARQVDIRLVPPGTVGGGLVEVPDFSFEPKAPKQLETVTFNASSDPPNPALDANLTSYVWDFGDGDTGSGRFTSHQYRDAGVYSVTLTVTDSTGQTGSLSKSVPVGATDLPAADFVFSPAEPHAGDEVVFNGSASSAMAPRFIVEYKWQFGTVTGGSATGMIAKKKFTAVGTYNVTLTVTDDAGNVNTVSKSVEVEP